MARPKLGETETERMQLKITAGEIEAIDDWRFANRVPSRSEAVRRLCQMGIIADGSNMMRLATHVMAHYIKDDKTDPDLLDRMKSGSSLETDVKRLCYAVMEQSTKLLGFKDEKISQAMADARSLAEQFKNASKGTHLDSTAKKKDSE